MQRAHAQLVGWLVTDSQYSSRMVREKVVDCGVIAVIPYPSNQRRGEDVLRVDRFFRVYGSEEERRRALGY